MNKIILYIGSIVFAALMVYNIGEGNLLAKNPDVSLESIKIMAAAADIEQGDDCPQGKQGCTFTKYHSNGTVDWSCSACCELPNLPDCGIFGCRCW